MAKMGWIEWLFQKMRKMFPKLGKLLLISSKRCSKRSQNNGCPTSLLNQTAIPLFRSNFYFKFYNPKVPFISTKEWKKEVSGCQSSKFNSTTMFPESSLPSYRPVSSVYSLQNYFLRTYLNGCFLFNTDAPRLRGWHLSRVMFIIELFSVYNG